MKHATNRRSVTIAVMVATFLTAMDSTVVSTAMPTIVSDLGGIRLISWVFAVYLLSSSVTAPIWGKLADLFGRKGVFQIGTGIFLLGSILSGASGNMDQLIAFRAFQGIGAGAVFPITLTIIGDLYQLKERAKIQGLFSAIWGIAGILGPLVGGFFVDELSWRWIFYINIPVGLVSMLLIALSLRETFEKRKRHIDYAGAVTFSVAMTALLYALLSGGQQLAWNSPVELLLFILAALLLLAFLWIESKSPEPMLPLQLFGLRAIWVSNVASLLASGVLIGITVYLPLWIQGILGHSATNAGLTLTPISIGWPIGATICGRIMFRLNPRWSAVLGSLFLIVGGVWLGAVGPTTPYVNLVAIMLLLGFGFGFALTVFTVLVQSAVGWNMRGAATASNQFVRSLGQTVGVAFFGSWFNAQLAHPLKATSQTPALTANRTVDALNRLVNPAYAAHLPVALLIELRTVLAGALHNVFVIMAALTVACFVFVFALPARFSDAHAKTSESVAAPAPEADGA